MIHSEPQYKVFFDPQRRGHWIDYDETPDHHDPKTSDEAVALAQEYLRRGHIRIKIETSARNPVLLVNETGVILQQYGASEELVRMRAALHRTWWEVNGYRAHKICEETGSVPRIPPMQQHADIDIDAVDVLLGGNFTLTLMEVDGYTRLRDLARIQNPLSGFIVPIGFTIEHDLAYTLTCNDDRKFQVNVMYKEVTPRRITSSIRPLEAS